MLLVANWRKEPSSPGMLDQIGTYGYVAEAARTTAESPGRRPLDRLAGLLGDMAARRLKRFSEAELRMKLLSAGMYGSTPRKLLGYQVITALFLVIAMLWLTPLAGGSGLLTILLAAAARALSDGRCRCTTSTVVSAFASRRWTVRCRT